jgi:hypothetical protein
LHLFELIDICSLRKLLLLTTKKLEKHTTRRERERNTKRGPTSKVEITHKKLKREKTPTQIQVPSLGPKPYIRCVSKSDKERGKNPKKSAKLRRGLASDDSPLFV